MFQVSDQLYWTESCRESSLISTLDHFLFFDDYAKIIIVSDGGISLKQINMCNKIKTN